MTATRDRVADELADFLATIGLDDPWSDDRRNSTRWKYSADGELNTADRLEFHTRLIDAELERHTSVSRRGSLGVTVTAGPPGAGKSTALANVPGLASFRDIDADTFKDPLLISEQQDGELDEWLTHRLCDSAPVDVRELSAFVHAESTTIASSMRERCLAEGENVIIHGTLSSEQYIDDLLQQLDDYSYSHLTVFNIEVPVAQTVEQALARWWDGRTANLDGLGGRFIAPRTILDQYSPGEPESNCAKNALALADRAERLGWSVDLVKL